MPSDKPRELIAASLIIKATRLCNLRCSYCHDWRGGRDQTMSFPILAKLIRSALHDEHHGSVEFIWHGGEPTVLPKDFYLKALWLQSHFRRKGQTVTNVIQTNATRLTPEWCRFFRAYEFGVGVSLDGPAAVHDTQRPFSSGRGSWEEVTRGIGLLREYEIPFSVLMVVDASTVAMGPTAVFDFFLSNGIKNYGLIAATPINVPSTLPGTPAAFYVAPSEMNRFLIGVHKRWLAHGDCSIKIRELDVLMQRLDGNSTACTLAGECFGQYFLIEPSGEVAHCDLFVGDQRYTLGHIEEISAFSVFRAKAEMMFLQRSNRAELAAMRSCPQFSVCNGWCPHQRYLSVRHNSAHRADCCGLSELIAYLRDGPWSPLGTLDRMISA